MKVRYGENKKLCEFYFQKIIDYKVDNKYNIILLFLRFK